MDVDALNGISFEVPRGSVLGLVGPNGAGKSTLLSILTGVITPRSGTVVIDGHDPIRGGYLKSISALVPQDYAFYPDLTGRENLSFFASVYGLSRNRQRRQLEYCAAVCRLQDVMHRRASAYSGGLKRRLNLAIGLLSEPRILYLDEPTVGIDADSRRTIIAAIQALRARGTTIIYASHHMEEIEAVCDSVALINRGKLVACDALPELLNLLGVTTLQVTLDRVPDDLVGKLVQWQPHWTGEREIRIDRINPEDISRLLALLTGRGVVVQQILYGVGRLEDVYWQLLSSESSA